MYRVGELGVAEEPSGVVPGQKQGDCRDDGPREFGKDVGQHEYFPGVDFGRSFSDFVD
jgi:hypothetical protein